MLEHMVRIQRDLDKLEMQREKTEHKAEDTSAKHWHYVFFPRVVGWAAISRCQIHKSCEWQCD